jgi:5-deoxy-glucuronate isomerase
VITLGGLGTVDTLLEPGPGRRLGVARTCGDVAGELAAAVAWVLVEGGTGSLMFDGPGWSAIVEPGSTFAVAGDLRATVVWRAEERAIASRVIPPTDVVDEERGDGATFRRVRTYVSDGPLIVGETLNPPGLWSSYPPHRHEHEEVYLYRFDPPDGFGMQMRSDSDADERGVVVRDGRIERITSGWHPVVAAPGSTLYYLWALAGADTLETEFDARYA